MILRIVNLIFGLTAIYYCLYSITRIEGKLEKAIIFLALAALVLTLVNLLGVMEVFYKVDLSTIKAVANSVTIFFTFLPEKHLSTMCQLL